MFELHYVINFDSQEEIVHRWYKPNWQSTTSDKLYIHFFNRNILVSSEFFISFLKYKSKHSHLNSLMITKHLYSKVMTIEGRFEWHWLGGRCRTAAAQGTSHHQESIRTEAGRVVGLSHTSSFLQRAKDAEGWQGILHFRLGSLPIRVKYLWINNW